MCVTRPPKKCVNLVFKHIHAASSSYTVMSRLSTLWFAWIKEVCGLLKHVIMQEITCIEFVPTQMHANY